MSTKKSTAYDRFLTELSEHNLEVEESLDGPTAMAQCPAHKDERPSLSVRKIRGSFLVHCHAGCDVDDVLRAIEWSRADLYDRRRQVYTYDSGRQVIRSYDEDGKKRFAQRNTKNPPELFRRSRVQDAADIGLPVYFVEGEKDVLALESIGVTATTAPQGAKNVGKVDLSILAGARVICVRDNDDAGRIWAMHVAAGLSAVDADYEILIAKRGKDAADHIAAGFGVKDFIKPPPMSLSDRRYGWPEPSGEDVTEALERCTGTFRQWFGATYDMDTLLLTLATQAVERMDGDPLWLMLIAGSGNTKTETIAPLGAVGALVESTISSEGGLLSASSAHDRSGDATGGLMMKLLPDGMLVLKDVTSLLSMSGDSRMGILAALREIYDGTWTRNVGTDGGMTLTWKGRIGIIGAVTSVWDTHHATIAAMGDRWVTIRSDSSKGRMEAGRQAIANVGQEKQMRAELAEAVRGVVAAMDTDHPITVTEDEAERILRAANVTTLARTTVDRDWQGNPTFDYDPEAPTRFTKQLVQVVRGAVAIGLTREEGLRLAIRCAGDSVPPLRMLLLRYLSTHEGAEMGQYLSVNEIRKAVNKPRQTVDRELQAMHLLGLVELDEDDIDFQSEEGRQRIVWKYRIDEKVVDMSALS